MPKLNQIVAIEKTTKETTNKNTAPLFHNVKRADAFAGLSKTYEPLDEAGEQLPDESVPVQLVVDTILSDFAKATTKLLDVILTKETANTEAFADVKLKDGTVLVEKAPVSFLLQLEKQLNQEVRGLVSALPVLDPAQNWERSASQDAGVFETNVVKRHRTKKVAKPIVLYQATAEFPAQTQLVSEDVLAGYWNEKRFSGAITAQRKAELLERVDELIAAVKFAREAANSISVENKEVGRDIFGYLFS